MTSGTLVQLVHCETKDGFERQQLSSPVRVNGAASVECTVPECGASYTVSVDPRDEAEVKKTARSRAWLAFSVFTLLGVLVGMVVATGGDMAPGALLFGVFFLLGVMFSSGIASERPRYIKWVRRQKGAGHHHTVVEAFEPAGS